jgi:hypothetical protein
VTIDVRHRLAWALAWRGGNAVVPFYRTSITDRTISPDRRRLNGQLLLRVRSGNR